MGDDCRLRRSQKLPHNETCVRWSVVLMQGTGVVAPLIWTFGPDVFPHLPYHIISYHIYCIHMVKYITLDKSNSMNLTSVLAYILISKGQINN